MSVTFHDQIYSVLYDIWQNPSERPADYPAEMTAAILAMPEMQAIRSHFYDSSEFRLHTEEGRDWFRIVFKDSLPSSVMEWILTFMESTND